LEKNHAYLFFIVLFCFASASFVFACKCGGKATVLSEFESSKDIFIAKIVSLEKDDEGFYY
jgi:hypothetical protein